MNVPAGTIQPTVLVYRSLLLPRSETFIKEQIRHLRSWRAVLIGDSLCDEGLSLSGMDARLLRTGHQPLVRLQRQLSQLTRRPPRAAVRMLRTEEAGLLHAHFGTDAIKIWPLARALELPMLISLHGFDINISRQSWETGSGGWWMRSYPARLLELATRRDVHFLAISEAIRARAVEFGIPEQKITVSYIGVDTDRFKPGPIPVAHRRTILFIGRLVEKKGCRYLLEAFAGIRDRSPHIDLVIAGDGPLLPTLIAQAQTLNIPARFLGAVSVERVTELLSQARVLCLPSVTAENGDAEGFGLVLLEAQASGVPVVTSARGGATEGIIVGQTGYAHAEGDVAGIRSALEKLLVDDELVERLGRSAREHVLQRLDIEMCTNRLEHIYLEHALNAAQPRRGR